MPNKPTTAATCPHQWEVVSIETSAKPNTKFNGGISYTRKDTEACALCGAHRSCTKTVAANDPPDWYSAGRK